MTPSIDPLSSPLSGAEPYFSLSLQLSAVARQQLALPPSAVPASRLYRLREVAARMWQLHPEPACSAGCLEMLAVLSGVLRWLAHRHLRERHCAIGRDGVSVARQAVSLPGLRRSQEAFVELFPPDALQGDLASHAFLYGPRGDSGRLQTLLELLVLSVQNANPAAAVFRWLFDDAELSQRIPYRATLQALDTSLRQTKVAGVLDQPLLELLRAPIEAAPDSLEGQLAFVRQQWQGLLPDDLLLAIDAGLGVRAEEVRMRGGGPGPQVAPDYTVGPVVDEERFSLDSDWMSDLVLLAKSVHVWFDQLSRQYGRPVHRLGDIPDEELDLLARRGFSGLWLIGIWERSPASRQVKRLRGNPEAEASAYALYDYRIADEFGGQADLDELDRRCRQRGIRLACDVVPNHTGIDSRWIQEHPDWFVQASYPPYPGYRFTGTDLSTDAGMSLYLEDGYWDHSDAAVVFKHVNHHTGEVRYIYHGNDGTHLPWNDTAQLNFLLPQVREAMIRTIVEVARNFRVIRFDAAMTLAKKHFQRLWFPLPGGGAGVPSRSEYSMSREEFERLFPVEFWREVVDRVAVEAPDTLLLAEAFWLMESFFVRTLGMHRVYNSAFMHMMKQEDNAKYRQLLKKTLAFNPEILKRFVNFMNNPDEATAVEQFGKGDKYFGVAVLLVTLPGLPMFGHGQVEGFREKYGMEFRRAYLREEVDGGFVAYHEKLIFPLLHRRALFSGSEHFNLYDFFTQGQVNEDVLAYSNRRGDQRALVVYHNRSLDTGGWVRSACPRVDAAGHARELTLVEALALQTGKKLYYRFRDHCTGLSYLRSADELDVQGLFVTLGPYQSHVFLDFVAINDTDGSWRQLWQHLGGRPVLDLDREYRKLRYASLLQALTSLLRDGGDFPRLDDNSRQRVVQDYADFLEALQSALGFSGDRDPLVARLEGELRRAAVLAHEHVLCSCEVLWPWLVLHALGALDPNPDTPDGVLEWLDRYLLVDAVSSQWSENLAEENLALLKLLLRHQSCNLQDETLGLGSLLDDPAVRAFLLVHRYQGQQWFNRERFERLVHAMLLTAGLDLSSSEISDFTQYRQRITTVLALAEDSGYQLEKFRQLV
ncbi:glycoside hydrolase, putative [Syntrophotalea carbinolica DSM 2380]|uniref:Glycoside hydrolase, putative n=1 Tax=Syntrophotalea carbinolica (strain DSM 2380 / NBRC 103641 / GraBd1) TaxID=338963 RepID=Q3A0B7_SYNC1|nr:alpha-amylase family glycosyl hydrolase [Syntrophotalea carbinolica]ABA90190.1 glycoside hydrolase, putative [Syntrophotalea carbinolica DSM 2380]